MAKKINPRKRPRTEADVIRARNDGYDFGFQFSANLFLFILADRYGWKKETLNALVKVFEFYCRQITNGEINYSDIIDTVRKEYGFEVT